MSTSPPDDFHETLRAVPWFSAIGSPHPRDAMVVRIAHWSDYPGPEDDEVSAYHDMLMDRTRLVGPPDLQHSPSTLLRRWFDPAKRARRTFHAAYGIVHDVTAARVLDGPPQDPYHPQTAAVMSAAYVAGLVACFRARKLELGPLSEFWRWYEAGHWPCGYARNDRDRRRLLVL